ncbi:MAG: ankyrin repeat domain-containing protein [Planctomycetota bacterium]|nr:ankyrin repeat domain-containing protein [Planctomycetota bacterium]
MNRISHICTLVLLSCFLIASGCDGSGDGSSSPQAAELPTPDQESNAGPPTTSPAANTPTRSISPLTINTEVVPAPELSEQDQKQIDLLNACKAGNLSAIQTLLEKGASANIGDNKFKNTPIMHATKANCIPCMELLLEYGADIHHRNSATADALMWAAMQSTAGTVQLLLNHGADARVATPSGMTALTLANDRVDDGQKALIIILLEQSLATP